jgi:hypothetical protein
MDSTVRSMIDEKMRASNGSAEERVTAAGVIRYPLLS